MFDLNSGEVFVVVFILTVVVSAPLWPRVGEWIAVRITRRGGQQKDVERR
jgi:hypothetical protein